MKHNGFASDIEHLADGGLITEQERCAPRANLSHSTRRPAPHNAASGRSQDHLRNASLPRSKTEPQPQRLLRIDRPR